MKTSKNTRVRSNGANYSFSNDLIVKNMDTLGIPILILGLASGILYFLYGDRTTPKDLMVGVILLAFLAAQVARVSNRHKFSMQLLLTVLWIAFNLNILFFSPYISLSSLALLLVMFSMSLMLKRRWFIITTAITVLAHLLFYFSMRTPWGQPVQALLPDRPPTDLAYVVMYLIFLVISGVTGFVYRRTLTNALAHAEKNLNLFRTVVDQFKSAVLILDTNLRIEEMNSYAVRLLDTTYPKALGKSIYAVIPKSIHQETKEIVQAIIKKSTVSGIQLAVDTEENRTLYLKVSGQILRLEDNLPAYIMVSILNTTSQKMTEQRIQQLAFKDHLTQIDNRLSFNYKIKSLVSKLKRDGGSFFLVYFDLNDFKAVNDERGHDVGDEVLREFAQRLRNVTRGEDFIARIGGDEFVLLMENLPSKKHLARTLARLRVTLNMPYQVEGGPYSLSVSFGVSRFPEDGDQAEDLLKYADQAMYQDKLGS